MPFIIGICAKIFIGWMYLKSWKRIKGSDGMLPNISHDII
jgi:hypothetical protein